MPRVTLRPNAAFDQAAPLSQARVTVELRDGRTVSQSADGARGYPGRLTDEELHQVRWLRQPHVQSSQRPARRGARSWRSTVSPTCAS